MNIRKLFIICSLSLTCGFLSATEFTISSYNCGGLSDHYDYLRAVSMQKVMQERYNAEPEQMALNEKIQKLSLKILFTQNDQERKAAQKEWDNNGYQKAIKLLTASPTDNKSPNKIWSEKVESTITSYKIRPVKISDKEVVQMLEDHVRDLTKNFESDRFELLEEARATMATRIFTHHMKYDIICLQEADYLDSSMFPKHYEVILADTAHSKNGIAFNKNRFELVDTIGNIMGRAFALQLLDKETENTVLVASGHITGCNPYRVETNPSTGENDSVKGDSEIQTILEMFDDHGSDLMLIGMDSNVTSLHPRLNILKDADYQIDCENYLEPTCTNPNQVLNTRIDWIALKANNLGKASITNIPVMNVGLNNLQTNISDHKPVAAKVKY